MISNGDKTDWKNETSAVTLIVTRTTYVALKQYITTQIYLKGDLWLPPPLML